MNRQVLLAVILGAVALLGLYYWLESRKISAPEGGGPEMVAVEVPQLSQAAAQGKLVFEQFCAACHGANAAGQEGVAPPLVHRIYESGHHADVAFQIAAQNGVRAHHWPFGNMPPIEGITAEQVAQVVTYVRELQRANGIN